MGMGGGEACDDVGQTQTAEVRREIEDPSRGRVGFEGAKVVGGENYDTGRPAIQERTQPDLSGERDVGRRLARRGLVQVTPTQRTGMRPQGFASLDPRRGTDTYLQTPTTSTSRGNPVSRSRSARVRSKRTRSSMRTPVWPSR